MRCGHCKIQNTTVAHIKECSNPAPKIIWYAPMANMEYSYFSGTDTSKMEILLDNIDAAQNIRSRMNMATPYDADAYDLAQGLCRKLYFQLSGDLSILTYLDNFYADCQESIRYAMNHYFSDQTDSAIYQAELDAESTR